MTQIISVAVVDDHPLFREGVIRSLGETGRFEIVGEGSCHDDAIRIAAQHHPDILLIDLSMPGGGLEAVATVLAASPAQRVVVLTVDEDPEDVAAALNEGARGFVLKGIGSRALADVLTAVAAGETYVTPSLAARLLSRLSGQAARAQEDNPFEALSARELEVLRLVAIGLSNKLIARRLELQEKTVKHHVSRVLAKLKAANRTEAALLFSRLNSPQSLDRNLR
jgi:two-component system nitrate/nitrite response regulator NarL